MSNPALGTIQPTPLHRLQQEVNQRLGDYLIQMQKFERLMKSMLASMTLQGTPETWEVNRKAQADEWQDKTLGTLVKAFVGDSSDHFIRPQDKDVPNEPVEEDVQSLRVTHRINASPEYLARTKAALNALKSQRNELVHHLLDKFTLEDEASCQAALAHLEACFASLDTQHHQLNEWNAGRDKAQEAMLAYMQSPEYEDFVVNGIDPDGSVHWPSSGVVQALREAEAACAVEGWVPLDSAIGWLGKHHPDQTLGKYQCKTWQQLLKRCAQFEIRSTQGDASARGQTWYRSKHPAAA